MRLEWPGDTHQYRRRQTQPDKKKQTEIETKRAASEKRKLADVVMVSSPSIAPSAKKPVYRCHQQSQGTSVSKTLQWSC